MLKLEPILIRHEQLVHFPELALCPGAFCGFGRLSCVRVNGGKREMPE
jgi:hypothetical protein